MTRYHIIRWLSALIIVAMIGTAPADAARHKSRGKSSAHSSSSRSSSSHKASSSHGKSSRHKASSRRSTSRHRSGRAMTLPEETQPPVVTAPIDPTDSSITTTPEAVIVDPMAQAREAMARNDPAEALGRYLRVLARDPGDLEALAGAGAAGLAVGDADAAINFYVRAEKIAPRDGKIKAGLASALVQKEQPRAALKLFDTAVDLGVPAASVALDRGLAYDLRGDNKRAQQEYALAVRAGPDAEATRRMALSMAIAGDRQGALLILDPLLRKQDIPAWRARAFVLAMTGDAAGAEQAAYAVLPRYQADELKPFLERLPQLKPAEKAAAVHFGHFPEDKVPEMVIASPSVPAPVVTAPVGPPKSTTMPVPSPQASSPWVVLNDALKAAPPLPTPPEPSGRSGSSPPQIQQSGPSGSAAPRTVVTAPLKIETAQAAASPTMPAAMQAKPPVETKAEPKVDPKAEARKRAEEKKLADRKAAADKLAADKAAEKKAKDREDAKAKSSDPQRYWVQIASGSYKPDLDKELAKQKAKWGKQLAGKSAWTVPYKATNRLLIGPFASSAAAQDYVNDVRKDGFSCFPVTTSAGQKVERLQ